MEPPPAAPPAVSVAPTTPSNGKQALPRPYFWAAVIVAAVLPIILLVTLFAVMVATNYNFLDWME